MKTFSLLTLSLALLLLNARAADWPGYRGANQDGISTEPIQTDWTAHPPKVLWKVPVNTGFSSLSVAGGKVFTQVVRTMGDEPREIGVALDATTGAEIWAADLALGKGYSGGGPGDGPRSTPTYSEGLVFILTPDLVLHALDAENGKVLWRRRLIEEFGAKNIPWNSAASPVVEGDLVFVMGGGSGQSLLAFHKKTGEIAWKTENEAITHATPVVATILGERQVIFYCQSGLVAVSVKTGKLLWKQPVKYSVSSAASPVVSGDVVYCSAGYGVGGTACRVERQGDVWSAQALWSVPGNTEVANHWSTPVCKDGYLYGMFSFKNLGKGPLKCVELATGKVMWSQPGFGQGNIILAGGKLLALADGGNLVEVEPTPEAYKELGRIQAVSGKCWSTPALSNGHLYIRSTQEAVCLDVKAP